MQMKSSFDHKILVVAAARFEAEPTLKLLDQMKYPYEFFAIGVGCILAAKRCYDLAAKAKGKYTFYIGSCGIFGDFKSPYLVSANIVYWMPTCSRIGVSLDFSKFYPPIKLKESSGTLSRFNILTSSSVSLTDKFSLSARGVFKDESVLAENMELYSVAEALNTSNKLWTILGVTNSIGKKAHSQWNNHHKEVANLSAVFIRKTLNNL